MGDLQKKTVSGLFWTFSQQFTAQILNFFIQIVLARLLLPDAFGLIAMLQIFIAVGQSLIDSGMASSLLRTTEPDQKDYSTVFFLNLIASVVIYIVVFFCAPYVAVFYKIPLLSPVLRVFTISFIIQALVSVQTTRLTKEMNFRLQMIMQIPSVIIGGICGIVMAYLGFGVWSLVAMNLVRSLVFMVQHWVYTDWRPIWMINKERMKYHFHFGYKLTLSGLLDVVYNNLYNLIIGKFSSPAQLGYYNQADSLRMFPVNNLSTALQKVTYPMFASIQSDDVKLKLAYKKLMTQVLLWVIPVMLSLIIIAKPLFKVVLGVKWLPAAPYFQLLCIAAIVYPLHLYNLNIINVKGRSDLFFRLEVIKKVLGTIIIFAGIRFGIQGLLYSQIILSFCAVYINTYYSGKMISYSLKEQLTDIFPMFLIGAVSLGTAWQTYIWLTGKSVSDIVVIFITGIVYFTVYLFISYFAKVSALQDFMDLILKRKIRS